MSAFLMAVIPADLAKADLTSNVAAVDLSAMDMPTVIGIAAGILILIVTWAVIENGRKSDRLRQRFGPEYEQLVAERGSASRAEAALQAREKRVEKLSIRHLSPVDRQRYAEDWAAVQRRFVDDPSLAVADADTLVTAVMTARGYPMSDFEQRAADISVAYPKMVQTYRAARVILGRHRTGEATTEDLRRAMVYFRSLFEELLEAPVMARGEVIHGRLAS
jgi:hypothetical protein